MTRQPKSMVPKVRFKGFTDEWEQRKLENMVHFFNGLTYKPNDIRKSGTFVIRSSNIQNGAIVSSDDVFVRNEIANSTNVKIGDIIVVVRNGSRKLIGKHAIVTVPMNNTVIGAFMTGIRTEHYNFINALLSTLKFKDELRKNMGATINQITGYMFSNMKFMFPNDQEMDRIGTFLRKLDNLITLHQRKLDQLNTLKKGLLQKMFADKKHPQPELRFKGFSGDWEQRKLGEMVKFSKGKGYSKSDLSNKGFPIILYGRMYTNYETEINNVDTFVQKQKNDSLISNGGEVIVPASGETAEDISVASVVRRPGVIIGGDLNILYANRFINPIFLALAITYGNAHRKMAQRAQGKSIVHLHNSDLANIKLIFPSIDEQSLISNFLKKVDKAITLQQRKLDKLKKMKAAYLNEMFV